MYESLLPTVLKLLLSTLLGGFIGLERETHGRAAGLRTHILVCLGSTLFTICSYSASGNSYDPGRVMAQIITGVGFLGAGTIMRQGSIVIGLTSAASIWTVSAIGMAVGIGGETAVVAALTSVLVFCILHFVPRLEHHLNSGRAPSTLAVKMKEDSGAYAAVLSILAENGVAVRSVSSEAGAPGIVMMHISMNIVSENGIATIESSLTECSDVISFAWE